MARPRDNAKHINEAIAGLMRAVTTLIDEVRSAVPKRGAPSAQGGSIRVPPKKGRRGPGKGNPKLKSKLKAYWANLTPTQRKARIAKMHAWRSKRVG